MKQYISSIISVGVAGLAMLVLGGSNLLTNGSFEIGDLTGWSNPGASGGNATVSAPGVGAQDGSSAVLLTVAGGGGVSEVRQTFPASPGEEFNMSGWMLTEAALPAGPSFGLLKIVFKDASGTDLEPASISIGQQGPAANPGVESLPFLNDLSPVNTWVFSEAQGVAPANTTQVVFLALNVDFAGGENPMWFDNIQGSNVTTNTSLISNGSFETGDLSGWITPGQAGSATVGVPGVGAQDGEFAALITQGGGVGELRQTFPANPGDEFNMSGWMLAENAIPAGPSFGLFKIVFRDVNGVDLLPESASIGQINVDFPGVESLPFLNDLSAVDTWVFSEAQGVAPAGTVQVLFLALNVDFAGGVNPIWFDNVQASLVGGEPTVVVGESLTVMPGIINSGGLEDLTDADNVSLVLFRDSTSTVPVTQFALSATSPTATPSVFEFDLEGRCVARPNVVQRVEFFNFVTNAFEIVDERNAVRMPPDLAITIAPSGDLSRFVDPTTREIRTRVRYRADSPRAGFSSRTDQAIWRIQ
jgi:hypothetical protein